MQRVVGLLVLALVLFWVIDSPTTAAGTVEAILHILAGIGDSIVRFVQAVV